MAYKNDLKMIEDPSQRFRVFLFSGESGYLKYCNKIKSKPMIHTAGLYSPMLRQLLIWNLPDTEAMLRTVRHEGFHQYLDCLMDNPPIWFNEGLAEYYEIADYVYRGLRCRGGQVSTGHLLALHPLDQVIGLSRQLNITPLDRFLFITPEAFYKNPKVHYAQSWAFIHFLRHSTDQNKQLFWTLFDALQKNIPTRQALNQVFQGRDLGKLQEAFKTHIKDLYQD
jgi:hypothetical protein